MSWRDPKYKVEYQKHKKPFKKSYKKWWDKEWLDAGTFFTTGQAWEKVIELEKVYIFIRIVGV